MKGHQRSFWESRSNVSFFCIQLVPSLFGREHTATVNNENSIMFSLNFCLLAAMTKITLQLSFTTGIPSQSLAATLLWGAAAQEYFKQESDRARCYQESLNEVRVLENSKPPAPRKRMRTPVSNPCWPTNHTISWDLVNYNKTLDTLPRLETYKIRRKRVEHSDSFMERWSVTTIL